MTRRLLTDAERQRFALYCRQVADDCRLMADNVGKNMPGAIGETLMKRERQKATAYSIVAHDLESMESFSVGGPPNDIA